MPLKVVLEEEVQLPFQLGFVKRQLRADGFRRNNPLGQFLNAHDKANSMAVSLRPLCRAALVEPILELAVARLLNQHQSLTAHNIDDPWDRQAGFEKEKRDSQMGAG